MNPHSWLYFDVKGADGTTTNWGFEFGTPNALARVGLTKADVAPGVQVHVKGYRSKNGGPVGYSVTLTSPTAASSRPAARRTAPLRVRE